MFPLLLTLSCSQKDACHLCLASDYNSWSQFRNERVLTKRGSRRMIERLDARAIQKISGATWEQLRDVFFEVSRILLEVSPEAKSELTTIYVKFYTIGIGNDDYAVVWLRNAKEIVIGLSLRDTFQSSGLGPPPKGTKYKGLTKYLTLRPGDTIPEEFQDWALLAFSTSKKESCHT